MKLTSLTKTLPSRSSWKCRKQRLELLASWWSAENFVLASSRSWELEHSGLSVRRVALSSSAGEPWTPRWRCWTASCPWTCPPAWMWTDSRTPTWVCWSSSSPNRRKPISGWAVVERGVACNTLQRNPSLAGIGTGSWTCPKRFQLRRRSDPWRPSWACRRWIATGIPANEYSSSGSIQSHRK